MLNRIFIFITLIVGFLSLGDTRRLPKYVDYCHRNDPNMVSCLKKAVEKLRPYLSKGIPEFQLPPLTHLVIPKAELTSGSNFKATFKNIEIYHAEDFILNDFQVDLDKDWIKLEVTVPKLRVKTKYEVIGKLLITELNGRGDSDGNFTNVVCQFEGTGKRYVNKGKEYYKIDDNPKFHFKIGKSIVVFDKIFGDNTELNKQTNRAINENIDTIIDELSPVMKKVLLDFINGVVGRIFDSFPISDLFPN